MNEPANAGKPSRAAVATGLHAGLRGLRVLEVFRTLGRPARAIEISRALGLPTSSADELLKALAAEGYLTYDARAKLYMPSARVFRICDDLGASFERSAAATALMKRLHAEFGGTVCLSTQRSSDMVNVAIMRGDWFEDSVMGEGSAFRLVSRDRSGHWRPSNNFAAAIMTTMSDIQVLDVVAKVSRGEGDCEGPRGLVERLAHIRRQGFALCRVRRFENVISIAAAWPGDPGAPPAAIGILASESAALYDFAPRLGNLAREAAAHALPGWC